MIGNGPAQRAALQNKHPDESIYRTLRYGCAPALPSRRVSIHDPQTKSKAANAHEVRWGGCSSAPSRESPLSSRGGSLGGPGLSVWLGRVGFVGGLHVKPALGFLREQIGADKRIEVAIENTVDVANFEFGAVVLDEPIGLHHIGTNLAAEGNVHLGFVEFVAFFAALLHFEIVEFRTQHFHSHFSVLVLAALHLTGDNDTRGNVRDADSGFDLVDVLSALAAGTEGVEFQVLGLDVHFDAVVNLRNHKNRSERSVAATGLIKGRNANEANKTGFAREQTASIFTAELNGGVLDAGFL